MLDLGLFATVSLTFAYVLANFSDQVCLLMPERVILLVAILCAEAIEAVKSRAALSASSSELILDFR
jgi:hypothetical protein